MISAEEIKALRKKYEQQIAAMDEKSVREELEDWWIGSNANAKKFNELYARISTLQTLLNQAAEAITEVKAIGDDKKMDSDRKLFCIGTVLAPLYAAIEPYLTKEGE